MRYRLIESKYADIAKITGESPMSIKKANDKYNIESNVKQALSNKKNLDKTVVKMLENKKTVVKKMDKLERKLVSMGVDTGELLKLSRQAAVQAKNNIKLSKLLNMLGEYINNTPFIKKLFDFGKSYGLMIVIFFIYSVIEAILRSFIPIKYNNIIRTIMAVFAAPIVEEGSKYISIKKNFKEMFFVVFNVMEWWGYVQSSLFDYKMGLMTSGTVGIVMVLRFFCVWTHGVFTLIHMENNESITYFLITMFLHAFHNALGSIIDVFGIAPYARALIEGLIVLGLPYVEKLLAVYLLEHFEKEGIAKEEKDNNYPEEEGYQYG